MSEASLAVVGTIGIARKVRRHRYVREAHATARVLAGDRVERVIGTSNESGPVTQLYGWAPNVPPHRDETGFIYFAPILLPRGGSLVIADDGHDVLLEHGNVYRLNDFIPHETYERGPVVCLFRGPYLAPDDAGALADLQAGADQLASHTPGMPRVSPGFQHPFPNECYADLSHADGTYKEIVPLAEAKRKGMLIAYCALCERRAWVLDHHFPWHVENNRCEKHLKECK